MTFSASSLLRLAESLTRNTLHAQACEVLENRLCMSAPAAAITAVSVGTTDLQVTVKYTANVGVDLGSVGTGDLRLSAAARTDAIAAQGAYSQVGALIGSATRGSDGSVTAKYSFAARGQAWDWSDTGAYTLKLEGGQVRSQRGEYASAANLTQYNLWFTNPHAELVSATLGNMSQFLVAVRYTDDVGISTSSIGGGDIAVTGPGGARSGVSLGRVAYTFGSGRDITVYYYAKVAQVAGSWLDRGSYTIDLRAGEVSDAGGSRANAFTLGTSNYASDRPSAQLVSSSFEAAAWTVRVRYRSDQGIDVSSIDGGDLQYSGASGTVLSSLVGSPVSGSDGSVVATYRLAAPSGGWDATPGAYTLSTRASQVFSLGSRQSVIGGYLVMGSGMVTGPAESAVNGTTATVLTSGRTSATTWEATVRFDDADGINAASVLGDQAMMVYGPSLGAGGGAFRSTLSAVSSSQSATSMTVTYRLSLASPITGQFYLRTNMQQVRDGAGNLMPSVEALAFTLDSASVGAGRRA